MIDNMKIRDAIHASIAEKILAGMDDSHRDALIVDAIKKSLTSYDFSREVEKVVSAKASLIAKEMVESEEWVSQRSRRPLNVDLMSIWSQ